MFEWLRKNWGKSLVLLLVGYVVHVSIEAFVITQIAALFGYSIPVLV